MSNGIVNKIAGKPEFITSKLAEICRMVSSVKVTIQQGFISTAR